MSDSALLYYPRLHYCNIYPVRGRHKQEKNILARAEFDSGNNVQSSSIIIGRTREKIKYEYVLKSYAESISNRSRINAFN